MYQAYIQTIQQYHNLTDMEMLDLFGFIRDNVKFLASPDGDMTPYLEDFQALQEAQSIEGLASSITAVQSGNYSNQDYDGLGYNEAIFDPETGREIDVDVAAFLYEVIHGLKA